MDQKKEDQSDQTQQDQWNREELRRQNRIQVKLAIHWGQKIGLSVNESIERWVEKYGKVFRDQQNHNKGTGL